MKPANSNHKIFGALFLLFFGIGSFWVYEQTQIYTPNWTQYNTFHAMNDGQQINYLLSNRNQPRTNYEYPEAPEINLIGRNVH